MHQLDDTVERPLPAHDAIRHGLGPVEARHHSNLSGPACQQLGHERQPEVRGAAIELDSDRFSRNGRQGSMVAGEHDDVWDADCMEPAEQRPNGVARRQIPTLNIAS